MVDAAICQARDLLNARFCPELALLCFLVHQTDVRQNKCPELDSSHLKRTIRIGVHNGTGTRSNLSL